MGKDKKEKKPGRGRNGLHGFLRIIQHAALAVTVLSVFVMMIGSTVRIQGFRFGGTFEFGSSDQDKKYEDSELFNNMFGFVAADIIRLGVVSSQLETDGVFDGSKIIDVTAYNYRNIGLPEQYVTANYYLEDLLKWSNYDFEYTPTKMTEEQERQFLSEKTRVTVVDPDSKYYNTSDASYLKSDIDSYTFANDVSANQLWVDNTTPDDGEEATIHQILVNRYKTAEGKNLEEYVSNWELYDSLCRNVENAAKSLAINYEEYLEYSDYYDVKNSNVRYFISKTVGENTQFYTNLRKQDDVAAVMSAMEITKDSDENAAFPSGKYVYYSPAEMVYETNTAITEETIRDIVQDYDYAYPETVKIWIGVDTSYPANDSFAQGFDGFYNYMPYYWQWAAAAVAAGILYLILLCYLTVATGKDVDEQGKPCVRLKSFDEIPTEAALLIACGAAIIAGGILFVIFELIGFNPIYLSSYEKVAYEDWFKVFILVSVFIADAVFTFFFYSLVRRIKTGQLWKNSFLRRLAIAAKDFAWKVYDNGNIVLRTWVPYGIFLVFNLIMLVVVSSWFGVILMAAVDILVGVLLYRDAKERQEIVEGIETIAGGKPEHQVKTENLHGDNLILAHSVNNIGKGIKEAVEISMKDERMKADLITNVSHDIKTPLTSIINYVDLIKREDVANEKVQNYIRVLDEKSQRLKQLTDDLVEASKISSGNISLNIERINLTELMNQTIGEFSEKFEQKNLTTVMNVNAKNTVIEADSRRIWRVMENLFNNISKYAMPGTRVYIAIDNAQPEKESIEISIKNISASPLNCNPEELTERFIRGDVSRTTEGSGLGLSIAKNLTQAQNGTFDIQLDGDLFKVIMTFPLAKG